MMLMNLLRLYARGGGEMRDKVRARSSGRKTDERGVRCEDESMFDE